MKFGYVIIYVEDVKATMAFYTAAFGFETKMMYEENGVVDYGELKTGETVLAFASHSLGSSNFVGVPEQGLYEKSSAEKALFGYELALVSEDVSGDYDKVLALGALPVVPPKEKPWGQTVAYVRAVEGTLIELCSPMNS